MDDILYVYYTNNNLSTIYFSYVSLFIFKFCDFPVYRTSNYTSYFLLEVDGWELTLKTSNPNFGK